jgi:hypothetical protein
MNFNQEYKIFSMPTADAQKNSLLMHTGIVCFFFLCFPKASLSIFRPYHFPPVFHPKIKSLTPNHPNQQPHHCSYHYQISNHRPHKFASPSPVQLLFSLSPLPVISHHLPLLTTPFTHPPSHYPLTIFSFLS